MGKVILRLIGALAVILATAWAVAMLHFTVPVSQVVADVSAGLVAIAAVAAILGLFAARLRPAIAVWGMVLIASLLWWSSIRPSNDRQFQPDVAVLPWAEIDGDTVTMHNVRNFEYRTETDYTPSYSDRTYDLRELDEGDILASYWMGDDIAHIFVSFGFGSKDYLAVSIETRKEVGESYSTLAGFFRRYELYYVVADERDLIGLRTNIRQDPPEDVYLYRTNIPLENLRRLFLDYLRTINELRENPEFYNTLTTNCTTSIFLHTKVNAGSPPLSWKVLASGHTPSLIYDLGRLDRSLPFEELRRLSHINERARKAGTSPDFSQRIREGLPRPPIAER